MSPIVSVEELIQRHFNSYQRQSISSDGQAESEQQYYDQHNHHASKQSRNDGQNMIQGIQSSTTQSQAIKFQTEKLRQELIEHFITIQASNLSLQDDNDDAGDDSSIDSTSSTDSDINNTTKKLNFQKSVSQTLINIINSILATVVSSNPSLTTQASFSKSEYYESSLVLLQNIASFISIKGDGSLLKDVLLLNDHLVQLSSIPNYESIRCTICTFAGWCSTHAAEYYQPSPMSRFKSKSKFRSSSSGRRGYHDSSLSFLTGGREEHNDEEQQKQNKKWRMDCIEIVMKEFLLKRLCDKNQAVRNVAIQSCCSLLSSILDCIEIDSTSNECEGSDAPIDSDIDDDSDEDDNSSTDSEITEEDRALKVSSELIQSLTWNMVHDPSYANRSLILQSLPTEKLVMVATKMRKEIKSKSGRRQQLQQQQMEEMKQFVIECIVTRVRDDKVKVRIDAFDVLRKVHVVNDLTVEMRCEILRQGLSVR